jgi:hypothetical protein
MGSGRWRSAGASAVVLGTAVLLGACGSNGNTATAPTLDASAAPSTTATTERLVDADGRPLTDEEAQAFREATEVVVAYRQTVVDLLSGARTDLNDLNLVVTGSLLQDDLKNMQAGLTAGRKAEPGARVVLVSAQPVQIELEEEDRARVRACIDLTGITFTQPDGSTNQGSRGQADYVLVRTDYLPSPGWAVNTIKINEELSAC